MNEKMFIKKSEMIANYFQVPTRLTIDEKGITIEVGGLNQLEDTDMDSKGPWVARRGQCRLEGP